MIKFFILLSCLTMIEAKSLEFPIQTRELFSQEQCDSIIDKGSYLSCYDFSNRTSTLVGYRLDGEKVSEININQRPRFYEERTLPHYARAHYMDYGKARGFDRGHLASDASFDWSKKSLNDAYSMINIVPQYPKLNRRTWVKAERYSRIIAIKLGCVDVLNIVVTSPNPQRIGRNQVAVPKGFYKVLYNDEKEFRRCFYYENEISPDIENDKLKNHVVDCKDIRF